MVGDWRARAACRGVDPETFFPVAASGPVREQLVEQAKQVCAVCPVRARCLDWALDELPHGVAGGLSEAERAEVRRTRPASAPRRVLRVPAGASLLPPQRRGEVIAAGRRALAAGFSRQRIAAEFGVSRRTVDRWAR